MEVVDEINLIKVLPFERDMSRTMHFITAARDDTGVPLVHMYAYGLLLFKTTFIEQFLSS